MWRGAMPCECFFNTLLGIEIEGGGEGDFDGRVVGSENVADCAGGVLLRIEQRAFFLRVDDPDPFDADGKKLLNFGEHADHAVFRGQNFDY